MNHHSHKIIWLNIDNCMTFNWKRTIALVPWWNRLSHRFSVHVQPRGSDFLLLWKIWAWWPARLRGTVAQHSQNSCSHQTTTETKGETMLQWAVPGFLCPQGPLASQCHLLGWWQDTQAYKDKPFSLLLSHEISWHKKCQSTGDWFNSCDLVCFLKIKIKCFQIATCCFNNI